jgi:hypothetical protein
MGMKVGMQRIACVVAGAVSGCLICSAAEDNASPARNGSYNAQIAQRQVPSWSKDDLNFFLHGSMSTEVVPEAVLRTFIKTYPDLFPGWDLTHLGLISDKEFGWPIGFSRKNVEHLGNMSAIGINCASCHVAQITSTSTDEPIRILGVTSHFNVEAFFGSVLVATFKTSDAENMKRFLRNYVSDTEKIHGDHAETAVNSAWTKQEDKILAVMKSDPFGAKDLAVGELHQIKPADVKLDIKSLDKGDVDLAEHVHAMLKLFHNMRAAVHVADQPPEKVPPQSGPGRNDAFGLLAASLLNSPQPYSPIKFGLVWNIDKRTWVHWDGNTRSRFASVRCEGNGLHRRRRLRF